MVVRVDLFTSVFCRHSPEAVRIMKRLAPHLKSRIEWNEISIEASEGKEKAKIIGIESVPSFVIDGEIALVGVPKMGDLVVEITKRL